MAIPTTSSIAHVAPQPATGGGSQPQIRTSLQTASEPSPVALSPQAPASPVQSGTISQGLDQVREAIDRLKQSITPALTNALEFEIDDSSGRVLVKILDAETNNVIRQIPSEEVLAIAQAIDRMQGRSGFIEQQG